MKKLLAIAVAAALTAPAAMAETTLYGKLHATAGQVKTNGVKENVVESHNSRIGVKGSTELDNGLSATYGVEYGLDLDGDNASTSTATATSRTLNARNTFVGVKGGFGEVRVGRHDTPAKLATAGLDAFADGYADMSNIIAADAQRIDNVVAYIGKFGPVGVAAAHSTDADIAGQVAPSGEGDLNGGNDASSMLVNYSNGPIYAGLGHTAVQKTLKSTNLGVGYKAEAGHFANVVLEQVKDTATSNKTDNAYVAGGFKTGAATLKVGYGESKFKPTGQKEKQTTLGVDYSLGKKTSTYLLLNEDKNIDLNSTTNDKTTQAVVGVVTEF
jgi:predicted porin